LSYYNKLRAWYGEIFAPIVNILKRVKVNNNLLTLMVFIFTCFSVFFLLTEQIYKAGACGILVFIFDTIGVQLFYLDGATKSKDAYKMFPHNALCKYVMFLFHAAARNCGGKYFN